MQDAPATGGSYLDYLDQRLPAPCLLAQGHDRPHIAHRRWEAPKTWSIWARD